jgi:uncharacterized protein YkwD
MADPNRARAAWVFCAAALVAGTAAAQDAAELLTLINAYRSTPQACEGRRSAAAGPLAPDRRLDGVKTESGAQLQNALQARGDAAANVYSISLSGPVSAATAMNLLQQRYCGPLLDPRYSNAGVSREGRSWRVVLARPLLSPGLGEWRRAADEVLRLTNAARARPRTCGTRRFDAAPPLRWATELGAAALLHSRDMASRNYFDHRAPDGSRADARATRQGYNWRRVGENIAAGQGSPEQVMGAWLASPPHCENIMQREFAEMGAAYAINQHSESTIYWTQVFGTRRQQAALSRAPAAAGSQSRSAAPMRQAPSQRGAW